MLKRSLISVVMAAVLVGVVGGAHAPATGARAPLHTPGLLAVKQYGTLAFIAYNASSEARTFRVDTRVHNGTQLIAPVASPVTVQPGEYKTLSYVCESPSVPCIASPVISAPNLIVNGWYDDSHIGYKEPLHPNDFKKF